MFRAYHQGIPSRIPSIMISFTFLKGCIVYIRTLKSSQRLYIRLIKCGRFVSCSFYLIMPYYFSTMSIWRDYIICSKFLWEKVVSFAWKFVGAQSFSFLKISFCFCVYAQARVWERAFGHACHMCVGAHGDWKSVLDPLDLEGQVVVRDLT